MQNNMQFLEANKYLIRYYYIYKYKSFHRAAENFYIAGTDRNMKYTVTQLEDFYGVQLIKVTGNKLDFTEFGHLLGEQAEKVFNMNIKINSILNKINLKEVNFATTIDFYKYYIKPIFDVFQKENSDSTITLLKTNQFDATERLLRREIDFIVGSMPINTHPDLVYQTIAEGKIYLVTQKGNEEKFKNIKNLKKLLPFKGAMNDYTDPFYYNYRESCDRDDIDLNIAYYTSDFDSLINAVRDNIVDFSFVGNYTMLDDIAMVDVSFLFKPINICFIYRKKEALTRAIERLIKISENLKIIPI